PWVWILSMMNSWTDQRASSAAAWLDGRPKGESERRAAGRWQAARSPRSNQVWEHDPAIRASYLPSPGGEGRLVSRVARCETGWGARRLKLGGYAAHEQSPHPEHIKLRLTCSTH